MSTTAYSANFNLLSVCLRKFHKICSKINCFEVNKTNLARACNFNMPSWSQQNIGEVVRLIVWASFDKPIFTGLCTPTTQTDIQSNRHRTFQTQINIRTHYLYLFVAFRSVNIASLHRSNPTSYFIEKPYNNNCYVGFKLIHEYQETSVPNKTIFLAWDNTLGYNNHHHQENSVLTRRLLPLSKATNAVTLGGLLCISQGWLRYFLQSGQAPSKAKLENRSRILPLQVYHNKSKTERKTVLYMYN